MENKQEPVDLESIKKKVLEQFRSGKSLTGKGGAFAPLFKQFLEAALEVELDNHLSDQDQPPPPIVKMERSPKLSKPPMAR